MKVHINYSGQTNNDKIEDIFGLLLTLTLIGYGTYHAYRTLTDVVEIIIRRKFVINKALDFLLSPNFCIQKNYIVMMDNWTHIEYYKFCVSCPLTNCICADSCAVTRWWPGVAPTPARNEKSEMVLRQLCAAMAWKKSLCAGKFPENLHDPECGG